MAMIPAIHGWIPSVHAWIPEYLTDRETGRLELPASIGCAYKWTDFLLKLVRSSSSLCCRSVTYRLRFARYSRMLMSPE